MKRRLYRSVMISVLTFALSLTSPLLMVTSTAWISDAASTNGRVETNSFNTSGKIKFPHSFSFGRRGARFATPAQQPGPLALGLPNALDARSPLSAALLIANGISGNPNGEVNLIANWDGREDYTADRGNKVGSFGTTTRTGISEHTYANGFNENVYYYGDAQGNFLIGVDTDPAINNSSANSEDNVTLVRPAALVNTTMSGGITLLNPQTGDCADTALTVTGIAVNPVADLGDFGASLCGTIGEVVYVSTLEAGGCAANQDGQPFRTRIFAFGFRDIPPGPPGGVTPVGAIQLLRNPRSNAGITVDDDGSLYFHLADTFTPANGGAIFKVTEGARTIGNCATNPRINRVIASIPNGLSGDIAIATAQGTGVSPPLNANGYRLTNYSGPATTFGNIVALAAGPQNAIYAAVARSFNAADDAATRATEGLFTNPAALGATPSMVISFADAAGTIGFTTPFAGAFDPCSAPSAGMAGVIPIGDGYADQARMGQTRTPGVNNFRVFVMGNGPDLRANTSALGATLANTLANIDLQIDYSIYAGLAVDEEGTVYVVSGGAPAVGLNPSPARGEILAFPDQSMKDRRADFIDLRGDALPVPPASGGNNGDGDSDRFDHIYWIAPNDIVSGTPVGVSGLSRGHLLYLNRTRTRMDGTFFSLPNGMPQGDDDSDGLDFEEFDSAGHQVAGGSDQQSPFRGDDSDGRGLPSLSGPFEGGFEYVFGPGVGPDPVWNSFFLNSNGNLTFFGPNTDGSATQGEFENMSLATIAGAWTNLNPGARSTTLTTFPLQSLGFSDVNAFKVRWINVPEAGKEGCGSRNTFAITLYDDGTGIDENASQSLNAANPVGNNSDPFDQQEGPTDLRFTRPTMPFGPPVGANPRLNGTGYFCLEYGRMDVLGTASNPVLVGYSIVSNGPPPAAPGLADVNLGALAAAADTSPFRTGLIGTGTEEFIYEFFNSATPPSAPSTPAVPDFDLRFEGNDPALSTPVGQPHPNRGALCFYGESDTPCATPLFPTNDAFAANGGVGSFQVGAPSGCPWTAMTSDSFITITAPPSGNGDGTAMVSYTVAANPGSSPRTGTITIGTETFTVLQAGQFGDVQPGDLFYEEINALYARGITLGCGGGNYCPNDPVSREAMAAFLIRALHEPGYIPPAPAMQRFADVPPSHPFYAHIEEMAVRQITLGCGGGNYCPTSLVSREAMAAFIIRALNPPGYIPPTPSMQRFADVPPSNLFYAHIEEMAVRGITLGCGGGNYCPTATVTRAQMAAFLVRAFGL